MSKTKHTPGPWQTRAGFDDYEIDVFAPNPTIKPPYVPTELAVVKTDEDEPEQGRANASQPAVESVCAACRGTGLFTYRDSEGDVRCLNCDGSGIFNRPAKCPRCAELERERGEAVTAMRAMVRNVEQPRLAGCDTLVLYFPTSAAAQARVRELEAALGEIASKVPPKPSANGWWPINTEISKDLSDVVRIATTALAGKGPQ